MNLQEADDSFVITVGQHPFAALTRMANAIQAIDRFVFSKTRETLDITIHRRLVYMRNTLIVCYDLWQSDVHSRVGRSRGDIYIFCMTDREKLGFQRRMVPALLFAAEEMRALDIKTLHHIVDLVESVASDAGGYVADNKTQIRAGMEADDDQLWREFRPLPLPEIEA